MSELQEDLTVSLIQMVIIANDPERNLHQLTEIINALPKTNLIVLPEVFTTGFCSGARQYAEEVNGRAYQWLKNTAAATGAVITGSLVVKEDEQYFNRMVWMRPDGSYSEYNKRHLFRMAGENLRYAEGKERIVVELEGWSVLLQVCYDLRFPVFSRNRKDYDLAIYVANWPAARAAHWNQLLPARAIENLSYVIGVNRAGTDEAEQYYAGDSAIYTMQGERLMHLAEGEQVCTQRLSKQALLSYREKFPAYLDADTFTLL